MGAGHNKDYLFITVLRYHGAAKKIVRKGRKFTTHSSTETRCHLSHYYVTGSGECSGYSDAEHEIRR